MIKRIKSLISVKNLSSSQFADLLGVQRSSISHILSGRNKPSLDFILKISEHFPTVSLVWLLKGNGEMFNLEGNSAKDSSPQLDILVENAAFDFEKGIESAEDTHQIDARDTVKSSANELLNENKVEKGVLESVLDNAEEIQQVMVLYKNGSFRVYTPHK